MRIEVRNNSVIIDGYVNAVERESRLIHDVQGAFVEKVKAGTFDKALKRAEEVRMLLNHDDDRQLATTKDDTLKLHEDSIGLRAIATVTDAGVIEKAKKGELRGWSFGFYVNADEWEEKDGKKLRSLTDIDLEEVSIIDNTKTPAYVATSVETRDEKEVIFEKRADISSEVIVSEFEKKEDRNLDLADYRKRMKELKGE